MNIRELKTLLKENKNERMKIYGPSTTMVMLGALTSIAMHYD